MGAHFTHYDARRCACSAAPAVLCTPLARKFGTAPCTRRDPAGTSLQGSAGDEVDGGVPVESPSDSAARSAAEATSSAPPSSGSSTPCEQHDEGTEGRRFLGLDVPAPRTSAQSQNCRSPSRPRRPSPPDQHSTKDQASYTTLLDLTAQAVQWVGHHVGAWARRPDPAARRRVRSMGRDGTLSTGCWATNDALAPDRRPFHSTMSSPDSAVPRRGQHADGPASGRELAVGLHGRAQHGQARHRRHPGAHGCSGEPSITSLTAVMLDLDHHFKQINDQFGHGKGDEVLTAVGAALKSCLRDSDFAGRFGGEEFPRPPARHRRRRCLAGRREDEVHGGLPHRPGS